MDDPYGEFMVQENKVSTGNCSAGHVQPCSVPDAACWLCLPLLCPAAVADASSCRPPWPQDIGRESHTADNQSAYWHERWTLRPAFDPQTGAPLLQQGSGSASQQPQHDVPAFLQRQKQLVLNTGKYLSVMRECAAQPPRTLPLGTHLGEWVGWAWAQHEGSAHCWRAHAFACDASSRWMRCSTWQLACISGASGRRCLHPLGTCAEYDEGGRYALLIEDAHAAASSAAMELLRRSENLADGLAVLKRYFLTAQVGSCGGLVGDL